MTLFCQWCDEFYEYRAKKLFLSCGHDVQEKCAKRLLCCLKCLKRLAVRQMMMRDDDSSSDSEGDSSNSRKSESSDESTEDDSE
ncbi:hypothetical protein AVEN_188239-1 [Araneus ventricosus]|uniref:Uncharacterized protein n=1 Tax=Araneus ventricosus TaxID=182803 RepID=A0A4Y2IRJ7_ARAVE|nr:hypothetical protein AVEN_188239-1 [Araneus ventricosus]